LKFIDSNGETHNISLAKYLPKDRPTSSYHRRARALLKEEFLSRPMVEELYIPSEKLYFDFFIPSENLAVEVQGEGHFKFNARFYEDKRAFRKAQARDMRKRELCKLNNIILIELPYNENEDEWRKRIRNRYKT
jgi:hypothetical protein